jgi:hypothetical protein
LNYVIRKSAADNYRNTKSAVVPQSLGAAAVAGSIYVVSGGPTLGDSVSTANEIFVP